MTKKNSKTTRRRAEVKDLPRKEKALSKEEQKKVKGGIIAVLIGRSDSTKGITDGTSNTVVTEEKG